MKGLLLKDLYCLGQNVKSLLFIIVIWGLVFLPQKDGGLLLISLSMMVSAMFTFTLSSYNRQVKWDTYALSMPLSRTAMVQEKYIVSILMLMAAAAISFPLTGLAWLIRTGGIDAEFLYAMYTTLLTGTAISLIYTALALPCSLWLGAEKGRYIPSVLFAAIFFAGIAMARGGRLKAMSPDLLSNFAILLLGLSLLVFAGSYFISISIYRKKEF
jgi:ABC-2 type transport system permease protein